MATSPVEVCNIALKRLGADAIVAFDEGTSRASLCQQLYLPTVDRMLREHEWNFAQIRVALAPLAAAPAWGYTHAYTYPTRPLCLKVNETDPRDAEYDVENSVDGAGDIQGKVIVTDEGELNIRYTGRIEDVTQWDASFTDAVAMSLAAQMAYPLTENPNLAKVVGGEAANSLQHARSVDSQEGSTKQADINTLVDIRQHGWREAYNRNRNSI
jgi:hypothetical protein